MLFEEVGMAATVPFSAIVSSSLFCPKKLEAPCPDFFFFFTPPTTTTGLPNSLRRTTSNRRTILGPKRLKFHQQIIASLENGESELSSEAEAYISPPSEEAKIDIQLPRRSLIVQFTCNSCGERTQRLVNRLAYQKGTIFVQCAGCLQHHKLVDNLRLVVEYDFREDTDTDSNIDQV